MVPEERGVTASSKKREGWPGGRGRHLVLIGLPGAGKSALGRMLAERVGSPFVDLDLEIESRAGKQIGEIFADEGEEAFRVLERDATVTLQGRRNSIVAVGGGWVVRPEVVALLRPPGRIIHLAVSPTVAAARMGAAVQFRPLLRGGDPVTVLESLGRERAGAYASADAVVDTETLSLQLLVDQLGALAARWDVGIG